jgi:hypothetical protein
VDVAMKIFYLVGNKAAYFGTEIVTFRVKLLPAPSVWKNKPNVEGIVL